MELIRSDFFYPVIAEIYCLNLRKQRAFKVKSMCLILGPDKVGINNLSHGFNALFNFILHLAENESL